MAVAARDGFAEGMRVLLATAKMTKFRAGGDCRIAALAGRAETPAVPKPSNDRRTVVANVIGSSDSRIAPRNPAAGKVRSARDLSVSLLQR